MREDWIECTFEDLLDYEQPTNYIVKSTKYCDDYKTPVLTAGKSFIKGYTNETTGIFNDLPTIIFDDFTTATQFVDFEFKVKSSAMKILVPTSKLVNMKFVYNCIQVNQVRNDTHKRYWISVYAKKKILLPPLAEQNAILAKTEEIFSDLDNGIANFKIAQEQLKIYRQAVLKKAFEGELTKEWREKQSNLPTAEELLKQIKQERQNHYNQQIEYWKKATKEWEKKGIIGSRPSKPQTLKVLPPLKEDELEELFALPKGWVWVKLGNCTSKLSDGPFGSHLKTDDYVENGIRVIRLENIKNLFFDDSKKSYVSIEKYNSISNHTVNPGDIIFSTFIADETKVAIIPINIDKAINKADCICIRPFNNLNNKYLEFFLSTHYTYNQLVNQIHGATRPRVNTTQIKSVPFIICSLSEQHQIVQEIEFRLSVCDKVEQSITESIIKAEALRQSILKKAFEGKLLSQAEIKQCKAAADYEPACVLLKKIKAEKLAKEQEKKKPTIKKKSKK